MKLLEGDCLELMRTMPGKSVDLILTDPPYNIGKAKWDKIPNYIEWCGKWLKECERLLKDNGSFYFWHNDMVQIAQLMEWIRQNTRFVFKSMITVNKTENSCIKDLYGSQEHFRNYINIVEYCLYYTFQDETGLTTVMLDTNNFSTMRGYFKELQAYIGLNIKQINERLGHRKAEHGFYWGSTQWGMPTPETYQQLINAFGIDKWQGFREHESLRQEYESLRQEYESLRYTFNEKTGEINCWEYAFRGDKRVNHPTQKPIAALEKIIKASSNPNGTILDCFMGSGSTGVACVNTNRDFIGIELDADYFKIAERRIAEAQAQSKQLELVV
jgi:DNA modification methylase